MFSKILLFMEDFLPVNQLDHCMVLSQKFQENCGSIFEGDPNTLLRNMRLWPYSFQAVILKRRQYTTGICPSPIVGEDSF